jgi:hypothetical protein
MKKMTLRKQKDTVIWKMKQYMVLCGDLVLEEAMDLLHVILHNEWIVVGR